MSFIEKVDNLLKSHTEEVAELCDTIKGLKEELAEVTAERDKLKGGIERVKESIDNFTI